MCIWGAILIVLVREERTDISVICSFSTSFCPAEKLQQIHQTFHEINKVCTFTFVFTTLPSSY